jgi:hypothetical protein
MHKLKNKICELVEHTEVECVKIADKADRRMFEGQPCEAVRLFYPHLIRKYHLNGMAYASCGGNCRSPSLLQELLLGLPVMVNLVDGVPFKQKYGMTPDNFAIEVREGRIIPLINVSKPETLSERFLEDIAPILDKRQLWRRIQLAHFRTRAFQDWYSTQKAEKMEEVGREIYQDHFQCKSDQEHRELCRALNIADYGGDPRTNTENTVAGRWRNIVSLRPDIEDDLRVVFHDLRDDRVSARACVLNAVKNLVSGPVSAGRGGVFRPNRNVLRGWRQFERLGERSERLQGLVSTNLTSDVLTSSLAKFLQKAYMIPAPQDLDYDRYSEHRKHRHWKDFSASVQKVLHKLRTTPDLAESAISDFEGAAEEYREKIDFREGRFANFVTVITSLLSARSPIPGTGEFVARVLYKGMDFSVRKRSDAPVSSMLAQIVWVARRSKSPPPY